MAATSYSMALSSLCHATIMIKLSMWRLLSYLLVFLCCNNAAIAEENKTQQWQATSQAGHFIVRVYPQTGHYRIGEFHRWIVEVQNIHNAPVQHAQISISGGMEAHGHGLPSQPQVTQSLGDGKYLIEGMLFNMRGDWTLMLAIKTPTLVDKARFDFNLQY